jgi:CBS domain-containing protein
MKLLEEVKVSDIMTRDLITVMRSDTLEKVDKIFTTNRIHHLPVVDEAQSLLGIISKTDYLKVSHMLNVFNQLFFDEVEVRHMMNPQLAVVEPDDTVQYVLDIFLENIFHALPVVEGARLVGLVTSHDILRFVGQKELLLKE